VLIKKRQDFPSDLFIHLSSPVFVYRRGNAMNRFVADACMRVEPSPIVAESHRAALMRVNA
jgi:hypothetical protein